VESHYFRKHCALAGWTNAVQLKLYFYPQPPTSRRRILRLTVLKDDKHAVFTGASHAQKAADYLYGLQAQEV